MYQSVKCEGNDTILPFLRLGRRASGMIMRVGLLSSRAVVTGMWDGIIMKPTSSINRFKT